jgi:hypothetical protein
MLAAITTMMPAHAEGDLNRLCTIAKNHVGDCACALEYMSRNLTLEQATVMLELWAAQSRDPQAPSPAALHDKQGHAAVDATIAFYKQYTTFQIACPGNNLALDDMGLIPSKDIELTSSVAGSQPK